MSDFSNYVNLRVFDLEPGDIYQNSIELARLTIPDFNLRPGTPEDAIFQAMSYVSALNIAAINRLPDRLMAGVVNILGLERRQAVQAQMNVTVTLNNYNGGIIPEGTVFVFESFFEDDLQEFAFVSTSATSLAAVNVNNNNYNYPSATITVVAIDGGVMPPIPAGSILSVISSGTSIQQAVVATPSGFVNGIDEDSDSSYLARATTYLQSLTSALVKSTQLESYLLTQYPDIVSRVKVYDLTYGDSVFGDVGVKRTTPIIKKFIASGGLTTLQTSENHLFVVGDKVRISGVGAPIDGTHTISARGNDVIVFPIGGASATASTVVTSASAFTGEDIPGYTSIYAYGNNSLVSSSSKTTMLTASKNLSVAGLNMSIHDPNLVTLTLTTSVIVDENYDPTQVINAINLTIVDFLSPSRFQFSDRIRQTQLISIISNIPGVVYVESLSMTPTGEGWLPKYGNDVFFRKKGTLPVVSLGDITISYIIRVIE